MCHEIDLANVEPELLILLGEALTQQAKFAQEVGIDDPQALRAAQRETIVDFLSPRLADDMLPTG